MKFFTIILFSLLTNCGLSQDSDTLSFEKIAIKYLEDSIVQKRQPFIKSCIKDLRLQAYYPGITNYLQQKNRFDEKTEVELDSLYKTPKDNIALKKIILSSSKCKCSNSIGFDTIYFDMISTRTKFMGHIYISFLGNRTYAYNSTCSYEIVMEFDNNGNLIGWVYLRECI